MNNDIQRATMLRRVPAWLLDMILLVVIGAGFLFLWSNVFEVTPYSDRLTEIIQKYETQYGGKLSMSSEEYEKLTEEEKAAANALSAQINEALNQDTEAAKMLELAANNIFAMLSLSILCAYFLLEFLVPLFLKNGQTLGKKVFGIGLMRKDGIKVTPFMMFARAILGKVTVETMIPVFSFVLLMLDTAGPVLLLGVAILLAQIIVPLATRNKTAIHDLMACTIAVDLASQMIFDTPEDQLEYYKQIHKENAAEKSED